MTDSFKSVFTPLTIIHTTISLQFLTSFKGLYLLSIWFIFLHKINHWIVSIISWAKWSTNTYFTLWFYTVSNNLCVYNSVTVSNIIEGLHARLIMTNIHKVLNDHCLSDTCEVRRWRLHSGRSRGFQGFHGNPFWNSYTLIEQSGRDSLIEQLDIEMLELLQ